MDITELIFNLSDILDKVKMTILEFCQKNNIRIQKIDGYEYSIIDMAAFRKAWKAANFRINPKIVCLEHTIFGSNRKIVVRLGKVLKYNSVF